MHWRSWRTNGTGVAAGVGICIQGYWHYNLHQSDQTTSSEGDFSIKDSPTVEKGQCNIDASSSSGQAMLLVGKLGSRTFGTYIAKQLLQAQARTAEEGQAPPPARAAGV